MGTSAEKLVKHTIKLISKTQELDYEELKSDAKKIIRLARKYDEQLYGMMEELLDLGNVGDEEELAEFDIEVLKIYCRIKEIDDSGSEKSLRSKVWINIQEEFELESEESEDESLESESESEVEVEVIPEPEPEPEPEIKPVKSKKKKEVKT